MVISLEFHHSMIQRENLRVVLFLIQQVGGLLEEFPSDKIKLAAFSELILKYITLLVCKKLSRIDFSASEAPKIHYTSGV